MKLKHYHPELIEAGCDEAGRGCLAGPVFAAAVILPKEFEHEDLNDSKILTADQRNDLRVIIEREAISWAVTSVSHQEIDEINILQASLEGMHRSLDKLRVKPELILVDGNRFKPYPWIQHVCVVKGDGKYACIAAASILAKTHRDDYMESLHDKHPNYAWNTNKGYPTEEHRAAIRKHGVSSFHRMTFRLTR